MTKFLMSPKCYEEPFLKFNFNNVDCLKMVISKLLGYSIVAGAFLLRVPQILKILAAKSGDGISVASEYLMMVAVFASLSYGYFKKFPYSAYGDSYFLFAQSIIVALLVLLFQRKICSAIITLVLVSAASYLLYANMIPEAVILSLNGSGVFLGVASKLNQAWLNFKNSSTGALSAITLILQFLGCVARIFTSIQETGDKQLIMNFTILTAVNGILVAQLFYYWNSDSKKTKKE